MPDLLTSAFHQRNLLRCQAVKFVHQLVDLPVRGRYRVLQRPPLLLRLRRPCGIRVFCGRARALHAPTGAASALAAAPKDGGGSGRSTGSRDAGPALPLQPLIGPNLEGGSPQQRNILHDSAVRHSAICGSFGHSAGHLGFRGGTLIRALPGTPPRTPPAPRAAHPRGW